MTYLSPVLGHSNSAKDKVYLMETYFYETIFIMLTDNSQRKGRNGVFYCCLEHERSTEILNKTVNCLYVATKRLFLGQGLKRWTHSFHVRNSHS